VIIRDNSQKESDTRKKHLLNEVLFKSKKDYLRYPRFKSINATPEAITSIMNTIAAGHV
jgi:hypothetical protein